jgi:hypothetical protein
MTYSLGEAAKATGKSKMTIQRAIKKHVIAGIKDHNGSYAIDPAELHRVFPLVPKDTGLIQSEPPQDPAALQREMGVLRELLADREGTINDLRQRLDQEGEERRKAQTQLTALLTDQRKPPIRSWGWVWVLAVVVVAAAATWWALTHPPFPFS